MKTIKIIIIVVIAIIASFTFITYRGLHTTRMAHVKLSNDKDIISDRLGVYVENSQHISA